MNVAAYWLLDVRGPQTAWTLTSGIFGGLYFPVWFFPDAVAIGLIVATPFPSVIPIPLDILVERGSPTEQLGLLGVQAGWVVVLLALYRWVQKRGERSSLAQLVAMDVATRRVGRVAFGVVMLVLAAANAPVEFTPARLALLAVTPIAGAMIFGAVFVATATVAFWWIESGEIANGLTYGGLNFTQYPITP